MNRTILAVVISAALGTGTLSALAGTGPSTTVEPYVQPMIPGATITSILTTGEFVGGYKMGGIPDGLGAFSNGKGTFTVLMNHEIYANSGQPPLGLTRAHGGTGAYVSMWVIDKKTLEVLSGEDLMKRVYQQNTTGAWVPVPSAGASAPPAPSQDSARRICRTSARSMARARVRRNGYFLNGEESGPTYQRGVAHVATGPDAGSSYVLPWTVDANAAWENLLANPWAGERTVVIGNSDGGTNGIYVYVGEKSKKGNDVERAGLVGGTLYRIAVNGSAAETRDADAGLGLSLNGRGNYEGAFTLVAGPDTTNSASTKFLRPEDGAWDTVDIDRYFFVTTDQMDAAKDGSINPDISAAQVGRSRLWALKFKDSSKPERGGTIEMLLDGTLANGEYQMFDNITVNADGALMLQEDVGNNRHNGKLWKFDPATGEIVKLARFDGALFGDLGTTGSITKDEESSGIIDVTEILDRKDGRTYNLFVAQNHAPSGDPETIERGQLLLMSTIDRKAKGKERDGKDK